MELVTYADIINAGPFLKLPGGARMALVLHRLMQMDKINDLYREIHGFPADEFVDTTMNKLGFHSEVIGFNVDSLFNNCLDVLSITDVFDILQETIKSLLKELKDNSIMERFVSLKDSLNL